MPIQNTSLGAAIEVQGLARVYRMGESEIRAVNSVTFSVEAGKFVALLGSSGSGKSSLLNLIAGLDTPTAGSVTVAGRDLARMSRDAIVFAMANPDPEVWPEEAAPYVRVMATGRSDYANQINNVLCFPGVFRGALNVRARRITESMKTAAARAIAEIVTDHELREDYIIPSVFNRDVAPAVAAAVAAEAQASGTAGAGAEPGFGSTDEFWAVR